MTRANGVAAVNMMAGWLGSAVNPELGRELAEFGAARARFAGIRQRTGSVAVIGLTPGEGRSTVSALLALTVAGWSDRRVTVLDTVTAPVGESASFGSAPSGPAGAPSGRIGERTVTALLGGDVGQGRLHGLIEPAAGRPVVSRSRLRGAQTPGAAVPVLSLPPGGPGFPPQFVEQTLMRLRQRADLVVIDTPVGPSVPVLHGVLQHADHFVLVVRGDGDVDRRLQATVGWLDRAPGRERRRSATAVVLARGLSRPTWTFNDLPVVLIPRDEGLRKRRLDRLGRPAVTAGLGLAAAVLAPTVGGPTVGGPAGGGTGGGTGAGEAGFGGLQPGVDTSIFDRR